MQARLMGFVLCILVLAGCAAPRTIFDMDAEQVDGIINATSDAVARNDVARVGTELQSAVTRYTGPERIAELFAKTPRAKAMFLQYFDQALQPAAIGNPQNARALSTSLAHIRAKNVLPNEIDGLEAQLARAVADGNVSGQVAFTLDDAAAFGVLADSAHRARLFERSLAALAADTNREVQLKAILEYASGLPADSAERARAETALGEAKIRRAELPAIAGVFPQLGERLRAKLYVKARFVMKGGDRLLEEDIKAVMKRRLKGVAFVDANEQSPLTITIEKVRQDERKLAERRETVTYAQHQVNFLAAALLMPRNASYAYDVSTSGATIDYGYVVSVDGGVSPRFEKVVRGTVTSEETRCSNARIQNVFGGVTAADFVANDDMARRCQSGSGRSVDDLRTSIFSELVDYLATSPQLSNYAEQAD